MLTSPVTARAALLQVLISGPGYGLELIDRVSDRTAGRVKLHQGSIYPALRAMEREGLVEVYKGDKSIPSRRGRPRTYYRITAEGRRVASEDCAIFQSFSLEALPC